MTRLSLVVLVGFSAAAVAVGSAFAQDASAFYKGKTVTIVVGYGAGGGYDLYSRLIARHIPKYVAGRPNVIVQNMPGAGSLQATNYVYSAAPKDGTVIANTAQDIASVQLLSETGVQYDVRRLNWLGAVVASNSLVYTWHASGIRSWGDAKTKKVFLATTDINTMAVPKAMNALLGTRFELVSGYAGTNDIKLALQRGEMMGSGGTTWAGLTLSSQDLISQKLIDLLIQTGPRKEQELPDVPLFSDLVQSEEDKEIAAILSLPNSIGYAYWFAPDVPAGRVALLRDAYRAVMQDADFLSEAEKAHLLVRPQTPEEIKARIDAAFAIPKSALSRTLKILSE